MPINSQDGSTGVLYKKYCARCRRTTWAYRSIALARLHSTRAHTVGRVLQQHTPRTERLGSPPVRRFCSGRRCLGSVGNPPSCSEKKAKTSLLLQQTQRRKSKTSNFPHQRTQSRNPHRPRWFIRLRDRLRHVRLSLLVRNLTILELKCTPKISR